MYRGVSSPMVGVAIVNAIVFTVYSQTHKYFYQDTEDVQQKHQQALTGHFIAGVSAGLAQSPVSSPIELAKTRLQLQSASSGSGPLQCLYRIHKADGLRKGVFRGLGTTLMREAPSYGVYFATYEQLTRTAPGEGPISTARILLAGGLAGTASWVISYPVDVIKSRLQADSRYSGPIDCFRRSIKTEGYSCMFRGLSSTIIRAFPTNAATFVVVTWTMRLFGDSSEKKAQNLKASNAVSVSTNTQTVKLPDYRGGRSTSDYDTTFALHSQRSELITSFLAMPQNHGTAKNKTPVMLDKHEHLNKTKYRHFDESLHFDWTQDIFYH